LEKIDQKGGLLCYEGGKNKAVFQEQPYSSAPGEKKVKKRKKEFPPNQMAEGPCCNRKAGRSGEKPQLSPRKK